MPVYIYRCPDCEREFEKRHGMSETVEECILCTSSKIFRIPALSTTAMRSPSRSRPGQVVDKYIEDVKKEVREEKEKLKKSEL